VSPSADRLGHPLVPVGTVSCASMPVTVQERSHRGAWHAGCRSCRTSRARVYRSEVWAPACTRPPASDHDLRRRLEHATDIVARPQPVVATRVPQEVQAVAARSPGRSLIGDISPGDQRRRRERTRTRPRRVPEAHAVAREHEHVAVRAQGRLPVLAGAVDATGHRRRRAERTERRAGRLRTVDRTITIAVSTTVTTGGERIECEPTAAGKQDDAPPPHLPDDQLASTP